MFMRIGIGAKYILHLRQMAFAIGRAVEELEHLWIKLQVNRSRAFWSFYTRLCPEARAQVFDGFRSLGIVVKLTLFLAPPELCERCSLDSLLGHGDFPSMR